MRQADIGSAFGVPLVTVKRYLKLYRNQGAAGFFRQPRRRGATVLSAEVRQQAQALLDQGQSVPQVSRAIGVRANTLHKAIRAGRLHSVKKALRRVSEAASSKSERSEIDSTAPLGYGTTRSLQRMAAAMGGLGPAPIVFEPARDIPRGGVLLALPALGLLRHSLELYQLPAGFYGLSSVFLLLALLALARIPSLEQLRYVSAGEWGNLLGLDRIPEVRTLRQKLKLLCAQAGQAARWNAALAREWIREAQQRQPQGVAFYVDGHVRVYHGKLTKLPRHYVARQRFYLRATVDYWINALDGQPFFYINKEVDHGLVQALRDDVLPWLKANAPISKEQQQRLAADPRLPRFTLIFDREGYSPDLFAELQQERIAALSYHRYPGQDWPLEEFQQREVRLASGQTVRMKLAERGTLLGKKCPLWAREVRKLAEQQRQISTVSTNLTENAASQAAALLARWSQENFFNYMREHFGLDALAAYGTEETPDTVTVRNPAWRELDGVLRRNNAQLKREWELRHSVSLDQPLSQEAMQHYEQFQGQRQERIEELQQVLEKLKKKRRQTPPQMALKELPEKDRFRRLRVEKKHFAGTIKMVAYRAETALAETLREKMARSDDARALLRQIFDSEADLVPDPEAKTLTVHLHHLTQAAHDAAVAYLCEELSATETIFPGTELRMVYKIGSP